MPLAIQLFQKADKENGVFYCDDDPYTWWLAKLWYNNADAQYHESCSHLGFTHLLMESVAVCTYRNLSPSHPIYKLLGPHFLYLLKINELAVQKLISPGGWVDTAMSMGIVGLYELVKRTVEKWRLDTDGVPMRDCERRMVEDKNVLPYYPYRDDSTAIYKLIYKYVATIVNYYYDSDDKLANDFELQAWAKELVEDKSKGGCGIKGVPGDGHITTTDQLITTMSAIINCCSVSHAAVNFNQYEEYGFPPNYPAWLVGKPPVVGKTYTERDILDQFPKLKDTLSTTVITRLLSQKGTQSLGDFEKRYLFDPVCVEAASNFRDELKYLSLKIKKRNQSSLTQFEYPYLDPEMVPNAISI